MKTRESWFAFTLGILLSGCVSSELAHVQSDLTAPLTEVLVRKRALITEAIRKRAIPVTLSPSTHVDTLIADSGSQVLRVLFSREMSLIPYREETVRALHDTIKGLLGPRFRTYTLSIETIGHRIEDFVPNIYRLSPAQIDSTRLPKSETNRPVPVVRNISRPTVPTDGLYGRNIVLSPSHGWMYSKERDRWEWQRPRLFQSVEDLIPLSIVLPYLAPMLENAGASVFLTRERDTQTHEVIVDNDVPATKRLKASYRELNGAKALRWRDGSGPGFAPLLHPFTAGENAFLLGTYRRCVTDTIGEAMVRWTPTIPEDGDYYVSVTFPASDSNVADAHYTLYHAGGATEFLVNQQIGGSTWQYLGCFRFRAGIHPESGSLLLTNKSATGARFVCADGVRFGGGMGMITRNGRESGRPLFTLGARYYLQYSGMPDTLVYTVTNNTDDYRDDFTSRPEYANYLKGAPFGPTKNRQVKGLGIPIDLSFSFHTDAGITHNDTIVGTLAIYSTTGTDSLTVFPDGVSRMANRDLADVVQSQVVHDLQLLDAPGWTRRDLWDAKYQEAFRPNMPSMLMELLSHQNFSDMRYLQDPRFRFDVSRAIYKGMLRFLAGEYGTPVQVQPLPVTHLCTAFSGPREVTLRWKPQRDTLEPTAVPSRFAVYTRLEDGGFNNGEVVHEPRIVIRNIVPGRLYSFKVTAINDGGESFPSEILSVCLAKNSSDTVLVVNGFTRVGPPAWVESNQLTGFLNILDTGVPDGRDFSFTGTQYDFNPSSAYRTNDGPGYGTSRADHEGEVLAGNTHDFVSIHGEALRTCGYSFVSASLDAVMDSMVSFRQYRIVDLLLGKQRGTHGWRSSPDSLRTIRFETFPLPLRGMLRDYTAKGGSLLVSGSYIGSDLFEQSLLDSTATKFAAEVLHYSWATNHASSNGIVVGVDSQFTSISETFRFTTFPTRLMYGVDSPDAIDPTGGSKTILRYAENRFSAATAYRGECGVVALGFPFESLDTPMARATFMRRILSYLQR